MLLLQANPIIPIYQYGTATGSAVIAVGLFIWSQVQTALMKKSVDDYKKSIDTNTQAITDSNKELRYMVKQQSEAQKELSAGVNKLAEAVKDQSTRQADQLELIRDMAGEQKLLMANQMTIMNGFQRVVEQLIDVVRE